MKYIRAIWCGMIMMAIAVQLSAQGAEAYKVIKANNGQTYLLAQATTGGVLYTDVYFRMGTVYELDSVSGASLLLSMITDARINAAIRGRNIRYHSIVIPAQVSYHFESGISLWTLF